MNYVDPTGLWAQVGDTLWEAQRGDTLWGLSEIVYGNGSLWTRFGYQDSHTNLQVGEIIDVTGWGRVGRNMGGYVDLYGGGQLYPIVDQMPTYTYTPPTPAPSKPSPPAANTPTQPTPSNPGNNASSSTSTPGNGGGGNKPSSKPNTGSGSNGKNEIYGPPVPPNLYGPPYLPTFPKPLFVKPKTDEEVWEADTTLRPLLDDLGYKLSIGESQTLYVTPPWVETVFGYEIKLTASATAAFGSGSVTVSTDTQLKKLQSISMKFDDLSATFDKEYTNLKFTQAINDEWAASVGYKWSWFTSYIYLAVAYSPKGSNFAVTCALYVKKQDWKHFLFKAIAALAIVFGPEILAILGQAGASAGVISLGGLIVNTVAAT